MNKYIDIQYFGNIYWINMLLKNTNNIFSLFENGKKLSFQNRTIIAGGNGLITLSTPLLGGRDKRQSFGEIKIAYQKKWQHEHLRSIESCYAKSVYWEYYKDSLFQLFLLEPELLYEWNKACLVWVYTCLKQRPNFEFTWERPLEKLHDSNDNLPKNYQSLSRDAKYQQVFMERHGFQNNLSVIDLIFCCGPDAVTILEKSKE